jgi:Circularly permutated YpsA SLOG family
MITKIISGGQTGADQAALDFAIKHGIPHGGWIPKDRKTEDGILPDKYKLDEMPTGSYPKRTEKNILDSDGTLIFSRGKLTGGSALTRKLAKQHEKPWVHVDLDQMNEAIAADIITGWIERHGIQVLNVAGPRASKDPGIHDFVVGLLERVWSA